MSILPTISVVCPIHDTPPEYLCAAVRSVLDEATVREAILVDDGSRDAATIAAIEALAAEDPRVRVIRHPVARGPGSARNAGLSVAQSEWIGFVDSDDFWLPGRGKALQRVLAHAPEAKWISSRYETLLPDGTLGNGPSLDPLHGEKVVEGLTRFGAPTLVRRMIAAFLVHLGPTLLRRDLLADGLAFVSERITGEDALFLLRVAARTPLYDIATPLYRQRIEIRSLTSSPLMLQHGDASMLRVARHQPELRPYWRELRWALYRAQKRLAAANLQNARSWQALGFALRALALDPREIGDFTRFLLAFGGRGQVGQRYLAAYNQHAPIVLR